MTTPPARQGWVAGGRHSATTRDLLPSDQMATASDPAPATKGAGQSVAPARAASRAATSTGTSTG